MGRLEAGKVTIVGGDVADIFVSPPIVGGVSWVRLKAVSYIALSYRSGQLLTLPGRKPSFDFFLSREIKHNSTLGLSLETRYKNITTDCGGQFTANRAPCMSSDQRQEDSEPLLVAG